MTKTKNQNQNTKLNIKKRLQKFLGKKPKELEQKQFNKLKKSELLSLETNIKQKKTKKELVALTKLIVPNKSINRINKNSKKQLLMFLAEKNRFNKGKINIPDMENIINAHKKREEEFMKKNRDFENEYEKIKDRFILTRHSIQKTMFEFSDSLLLYNAKKHKEFNDKLEDDGHYVSYEFMNVDGEMEQIIVYLDKNNYYAPEQIQFYNDYLSKLKNDLYSFLKYQVTKLKSIKYYVFKKINRIEGYHLTKIKIINNHVNFNVDDNIIDLDHKIKEFLGSGSGYLYSNIVDFKIHITQYNPLRGGSYIELPCNIKESQACINIKNKDDKCFKYSVLAGMYPVNGKKHPNRVSNYTQEFKDSGIQYPVRIQDIPKIEKMNNISVNVYGYNKQIGPYPLYVNKHNCQTAHNLLLINEGNNYHYAYIKSFSRLIANFNKHKEKKHVCMKCIHVYSTAELLKKHIEDCNPDEPTKLILPIEGKNDFTTFKNFKNKLRVPYVIYADFEAITKKINNVSRNICNESFTDKYQQHVSCGACYKVISVDKSYNKEFIFRGENSNDEMIKSLIETKNEIIKKLLDVSPIELTNEEEEIFQNSTKCHVCDKDLENKEIKGEALQWYKKYSDKIIELNENDTVENGLW